MPRWSPGRMQPPLRARSFLSDQRCRLLSALARHPVRHSAPLQSSMIARPHEAGLVDSWRADSQSRSVARSRNYPMCENSSARRTRRNISEQLHFRESNHTAYARFDALLENCFFYIWRMYEFLHSQGQSEKGSRRAHLVRNTSESRHTQDVAA